MAKTMRTAHIVFAVCILVLLAGFIFQSEPRVRDCVTGESIEGMFLEPIGPASTALLEPIWGFMANYIGLLPYRGLIAWVLGIPLIVFIVSLVRWRRRYRDARPGWAAWLCAIGSRLLFCLGAYVLLAGIPRVLGLVNWISGDVEDILTPVGLPAVVFGALLIRNIAVKEPDCSYAAVFFKLLSVFIGVLGFEIIIVYLLMFCLPGAQNAGYRLSAGEDVYVTDLHSHTSIRKDANRGAPEKLELFDRHGIDISATTEHNYRIAKHEGDDDFESMTRMSKDKNYDMLILPGEEFTTHAVHLVLLGVNRNYKPRDYRFPDGKALYYTPPHYGYDVKRLIDDVHAEGGYVVIAHWWTLKTLFKIDWRLLLDYGADAIEVHSSAEWAPQELIDTWRERGVLLLCGSDFHYRRKTLLCWNLLDRAAINPGNKPIMELDPHEVIDRIFETKKVRPVTAAYDNRRVPSWLLPPVTLWQYAARLKPYQRLTWILYLAALWWIIAYLPQLKRGLGDFFIPRPKPPATDG